MDKLFERQIFDYVYGRRHEWKTIVEAEEPDFLCAKENTLIGVEITELFLDQSDARLRRVDGYSLKLLNGGNFLHKSDKENIKIDKIKYFQNGDPGCPGIELSAIIQRVPHLTKKASLLSATIAAKEKKIKNYLKSCSAVDLIINDASALFMFDKYENMIIPLFNYIDRNLIANSGFREIYLITRNTDNIKIKVPLKLNMFAQDVTIIEKLLVEWGKTSDFSDSNKMVTILLYCLYKCGYKKLTLTVVNNELQLIIGSHLFSYTKEGKKIQDYSTHHEQLPRGIKLFEMLKEVKPFQKKIAKEILKKKKKKVYCLPLFEKVDEN